MPTDYSKTIIYKLSAKDPAITSLYVGSTVDLIQRTSLHKGRCNIITCYGYELKVYNYIREHGGWDNWECIVVEKYPCETKLEKLKRERYWQDLLQADLNSNIPSRTIQEWRIDNRDDLLKKKKEYWFNNRDKYIEKKNKNYADNRDEINKKRKEQAECPICCKTMRKDSLSRHTKSVH